MLRRLGQALIVFGAAGFLSTFCLPMAGAWLNGVELPTFFETTTIALPDGGRLHPATMPTPSASGGLTAMAASSSGGSSLRAAAISRSG